MDNGEIRFLQKAALEGSLCGIFFADLNGLITYTNNTLLEMWEYLSPEELIGLPAVSLWADLVDAESRLFEVTNNKTTDGRMLAKRKDGSTFMARHITNLVHDSDGKSIGYYASILPVYEHEENTRKSAVIQQRFRSFLNNINVAVALHEIITDKTGNPVDWRFIYINQEYEKITHLNREDVIGKTGREVIPEFEEKWAELYGRVAMT